MLPETSRFVFGCEQPASHISIFDDDKSLPGGTSHRCAEAARNVNESDLGSLSTVRVRREADRYLADPAFC